MADRCAKLSRKTKETDISVGLNIDGTGKSNIDTGIGFFNHMLEGFSKHGFFDLDMTCDGYSMTQIAEQLKRNIKTIRAHKFNVMSKLGVSSDAGLLEAADILLCMRHCEASNVLHPY